MFYVPSSIHIGSLNRSSVGDGGWAVGLAEAWRMVHDLNQAELANASKPSQSPNNPGVIRDANGECCVDFARSQGRCPILTGYIEVLNFLMPYDYGFNLIGKFFLSTLVDQNRAANTLAVAARGKLIGEWIYNAPPAYVTDI
ncbi:hypothetical protein V6N12_007116 [Hibiscus sabdariffa]|uniref:Uncharacterized protein n=1 Tax=Hibiscus sabdariffa TaxID=183260 RepID=A0ABR2F0U7_9ROSI